MNEHAIIVALLESIDNDAFKSAISRLGYEWTVTEEQENLRYRIDLHLHGGKPEVETHYIDIRAIMVKEPTPSILLDRVMTQMLSELKRSWLDKARHGESSMINIHQHSLCLPQPR